MAAARYRFTEDVAGRKVVELEVGRDGHLYRRRGMLGQLLGDDDGPVGLDSGRRHVNGLGGY